MDKNKSIKPATNSGLSRFGFWSKLKVCLESVKLVLKRK